MNISSYNLRYHKFDRDMSSSFRKLQRLRALERLEYLEELENLEKERARAARRRKQNHRTVLHREIEELSDAEFLQRYRLDKSTVNELHDKLHDRLLSASDRNNPFSPMDRMLIALRYYATGELQINVGSMSSASQATCSRVIKKVSDCLASLLPEYIFLPKTEEERKRISDEFLEDTGFPHVYGILDCTHVKIQSPRGEDTEMFRNNMGYCSLKVQSVSDSRQLIRHLVARWPGSTESFYIFSNSSLYATLEAGKVPSQYHLIGNEDYECMPYLLTPMVNPDIPAETRYNESHKKVMDIIERQFTQWKKRFPCLSRGLRCNIQTVMSIICATAVLHNIAVDQHIELPEDKENEIPSHTNDELPNDDDDEDEPLSDSSVDYEKRLSVINKFFTK